MVATLVHPVGRTGVPATERPDAVHVHHLIGRNGGWLNQSLTDGSRATRTVDQPPAASIFLRSDSGRMSVQTSWTYAVHSSSCSACMALNIACAWHTDVPEGRVNPGWSGRRGRHEPNVETAEAPPHAALQPSRFGSCVRARSSRPFVFGRSAATLRAIPARGRRAARSVSRAARRARPLRQPQGRRGRR
jgi:hypothetical protein